MALEKAPTTERYPECSSTMMTSVVKPPGDGWGSCWGSNERVWPALVAGADVEGGREGALYLPAAQCTQCPRRDLLSVMSLGTRDVGILPVDMQRERLASEGWPRA